MKWFLMSILSLLLAAPGIAQQTQPSQEDQAPETREVTLKDAIDLALKNNLDIEIEKYNPEITDTQQTFEKSKFEPFFGGVLNYNDSTFQSGSSLQGESIKRKTLDFNFHWEQKLYTGTLYAIDFNNSRLNTSQLFTNINPQFNTTIFGSITQPLMRNFGIQITQAPLRIAQQNRLTSDEQLRVRIMDIALQVEQAYWDLVFYRDQLNVSQQSLARAKELYENNKKQVEVGTMAPLEVVAAEAEVASREEGIITSDSFIRNTEDSLKKLVLGNSVARSWKINVIPTEKADLRPLEMTEDEAIQKAMTNNPDLKALESDLRSRELTTKLAANALKPQLDAKVGYGLSGLGGTTLLTDNNFPPNVIGTIPGGYGDALSALTNNPSWSMGLTLGIPIGNGAARADFVRADLLQKQAATILDNAKQNLILNIRTAIRNMENSSKSYEAATASRVLQERKLDAEKKKLEVGLSTNYVVLQYQDDLAQAQSRELLYITAYSKNAAQLKRYLGEYLSQ